MSKPEVSFMTDRWDFTGALCAEMPDTDEIFFPKKSTHALNRAAQNICSMCKVKSMCFSYALLHPDIAHGIWGGIHANEIVRLRSVLNSLNKDSNA
jgi:hypothetical protein